MEWKEISTHGWGLTPPDKAFEASIEGIELSLEHYAGRERGHWSGYCHVLNIGYELRAQSFEEAQAELIAGVRGRLTEIVAELGKKQSKEDDT